MPDGGWYLSKTTIVSTATDRAVEFTRRLGSSVGPKLDPHDTRGAPPRPPVPGVVGQLLRRPVVRVTTGQRHVWAGPSDFLSRQVVPCPDRGAGAISHPDPAEHVAEVDLDGPLADLETPGYLLVGHAARDKPQHLELAHAQSRSGRRCPVRQQGASDPRVEWCMAGGRRADRREHVARLAVLEEVPDRPRCQCLGDPVTVRVDRVDAPRGRVDLVPVS